MPPARCRTPSDGAVTRPAMQPMRPPRRDGWILLGAAWLLCGALVLLHQRAIGEYVQILDTAGGEARTELTTPLRQVIPARHADAQMWVRHVMTAQEQGVA